MYYNGTVKDSTGEIIGWFEYISLSNNILVIHDITVFTPFRKRGHGRRFVYELFKKYPNVNQIFGLSSSQSIGFWKAIGATLSRPLDKSDDAYFVIRKHKQRKEHFAKANSRKVLKLLE